jgi:hypothetical protein
MSLTTLLVLGGVPVIGLLLWRRQEQLEEQRQAQEMELAANLRAAIALAPGGSAEQALVVTTPSVIEVRAAAMGCLVCERPLELRDHAVAPGSGGSLRVVHLSCRVCHAPRKVWFRLERAAEA